MRFNQVLSILALCLTGMLPAYAQRADLARATCSQFLQLSENDRSVLLVWLNGYYAGAAQRSFLDRDQLNNSLKSMSDVCAKNPSQPLIGEQARNLFLGNPQPAQGTGVPPTPSLNQGSSPNSVPQVVQPGGGAVFQLPSPGAAAPQPDNSARPTPRP